MPSPRPKPRNLKLISGTNRPDRDEPDGPSIEYEVVTVIPEPPGNLGYHGTALWHSHLPIFVKAGTVQIVDLTSFHLLCKLWQNAMQDADCSIKSPSSENQTLIGLFDRFGMTPASRSKIKQPGNTKPRNEFEE